MYCFKLSFQGRKENQASFSWHQRSSLFKKFPLSSSSFLQCQPYRVSSFPFIDRIIMVLLDESMVVTYQRRVDRLQERIADLNKELAQHVKAFFELQGQLHVARYNSLHFKSDKYAEEVLVLDWALRWEKGQRDETRRKIEMNEWLMEEPTRELALVKHMIQTKPVLISGKTYFFKAFWEVHQVIVPFR